MGCAKKGRLLCLWCINCSDGGPCAYLMDRLHKQWRRTRRRRKAAKTAACAVVAAIALFIGISTTVMALTRSYEPAAAVMTEPANESAEPVMTDVSGATVQAKTGTDAKPAADEPVMTYIGEFFLTAYCSCPVCCGKWAGGPTASGVMPQAKRTIAVDNQVIPLGTHVYIEGLGEYIAEDTGTSIKGNHIDIYMGSHKEAKWFANGAGSCTRNVWIIADK